MRHTRLDQHFLERSLWTSCNTKRGRKVTLNVQRYDTFSPKITTLCRTLILRSQTQKVWQLYGRQNTTSPLTLHFSCVASPLASSRLSRRLGSRIVSALALSCLSHRLALSLSSRLIPIVSSRLTCSCLT